jgi:hypothetical protein
MAFMPAHVELSAIAKANGTNSEHRQGLPMRARVPLILFFLTASPLAAFLAYQLFSLTQVR